MTPELARQLSGVASLAAFVALLYLFSVQIRLGPDDRQKWAATSFVFLTLVIIGQICVSYLGGPSLANSPRGVISYTLWAVTIVGLAWETRRYLRGRGE